MEKKIFHLGFRTTREVANELKNQAIIQGTTTSTLIHEIIVGYLQRITFQKRRGKSNLLEEGNELR